MSDRHRWDALVSGRDMWVCDTCGVVRSYEDGPRGGRVYVFTWTTAPGTERTSKIVRPSCWRVELERGLSGVWDVIGDEALAPGEVQRWGQTWFCHPYEVPFWTLAHDAVGIGSLFAKLEPLVRVARDAYLEGGIDAAAVVLRSRAA